MIMYISLQTVKRILRTRPQDAHKGTMGHALIASGSFGMAGCTILASEACMRSGIGKLTIHTPACNRTILQTAVPEAILQIEDATDYLNEAPIDLTPYKAIGIGPGLGKGAEKATASYSRNSSAPMVVDADALRVLAKDKGLITHLRGRAILTPHMGEMSMLAEGLELQGQDIQEKAKKLAIQSEVVVVLKGHPTHIYLPNENEIICDRGNAGMATAGSGDVLTGIITGLLTQGYSLEEAAILGVWLHATAGDFAAQELGQEYLLARDIARFLSRAFKEIRENKN